MLRIETLMKRNLKSWGRFYATENRADRGPRRFIRIQGLCFSFICEKTTLDSR